RRRCGRTPRPGCLDLDAAAVAARVAPAQAVEQWDRRRARRRSGDADAAAPPASDPCARGLERAVSVEKDDRGGGFDRDRARCRARLPKDAVLAQEVAAAVADERRLGQRL